MVAIPWYVLRSGSRATTFQPIILNEKLIIFDTKLIIFDTKLIILNDNLIIFDTKLITLNDKLIRFEKKLIILNEKWLDVITSQRLDPAFRPKISSKTRYWVCKIHHL